MYGYGHGPGTPPPQRTPTHVVVWRVLFAVLPLLSIGFLTGATTLRLAIVTRRPRDWWLFGLSIVTTIGCLMLTSSDPESVRNSFAAGAMLLNAALFTGYFLYADIRHHDAAHAAPAQPYARTHPQTPAPGGYAYPQQAGPARPPQPNPYTQTPPHTTGAAHAQTPPPQATPQPQGPPSPRIHQVRAELDELSDLLRRDERP
ncbi:hypothetical protein BJP40_17780 [Streptomyces sp. CC53]|uniref:hypothetical protein n=1 Tax=unclassified Streptomyces TaxID=2593676 RepID=UPI0008DD5C62|nr:MULTISPECIES: hypothetical protein [unclassified Streptomyces]OII65222.1 hypothetical protein BJP40_17780 [Streptomyces sp. CC53]